MPLHPPISARRRGFGHPVRKGAIRFVAGLLSTVLVTAGLVVGIVIAPAVAAAPLSITSVLTPRVLAGDPSTVALTATNGGTTDYFNASYRYELSQGVSYTSGSSRGPNGVVIADPNVVTVVDTSPVGTHQILIWSNVADLPAGLAATLTFGLTSTLPVGSTFGGNGSVYTNTDPRLIAKFDSAGNAISGFDNSAIAPSAPLSNTRVTALKVTKSEPSPEHELMRGVHTQQQTYTIVTQNTTQGATDSVVVVDYLPAALEFLGCTGAADNTTGQTPEFGGSGPLVTTAGGSNCVAPTLVETINNRPPAADGTVFPAAFVFTKVTWTIGTLAAGASSTITYAAGIPLRENVMFAAGTAPSSASGAQGSNLDNNTGPSTRQVNGGQGLTNTVTASGNYQGTVATAADRATSSTDSLTVKAMDLSIVKGVANPTFNTTGTTHFTLLVRASEYTQDSAMTIVDTIPDGLCPLVSGIINNSGSSLPAGCFVTTSTVSNATVEKATANADGTFTLTLTPSPTVIPKDGSLTVGYDAFEGTNYRGGGQTAPIVAGDSFTNSVTIAGSTTDQTGAQTPAVVQATDDSSAALQSGPPSISKKVLPRPTPSPGTAVDCAAATGYTNSAKPTYLLGDKVCFQLTVTFSTTTPTRNARVTDFVPTGTTYNGFQLSAGNAVTVTAIGGTQSSTTNPGTLPAAWDLGDTQGGTDHFVAKGAVLTLYVSAIVTSLSSTSVVDITANLMKYREVSTNNAVLALRDQADYGIAPAPVVSLGKAVTAVNGVTLGSPSKNAQVKEGDVVTFRLDLANAWTVAAGNAVDVNNLTVWDALPAGYNCAGWNIQVLGGLCQNPGDAGYPANSATPSGRSVIVWTLTDAVAAGVHHAPVTYTATVPTTLSVSALFTNTASVVAFTSPNTAGSNTNFFPKGSLNPAHNTDGNTSPANDNATIHLPDAVAVKSGTTSITSTNNNLATQAVPGETVDYTYSVNVPAGTSVFNAVLSDTLPTGLKLPTSPQFTATRDGTALPAGVSLNTANGTLSFGTTWNNSTAADQVFTVVASGVIVDAGLVPGSPATISSITNTANFTSTMTADTASSSLSQNKTYTVAVINPAPTLTKTVDKPLATGGDTVVFTLTAANTAGAPDAFNPVIVDCLPTGLTFVSSIPAPTATGTCSGGVQLSWNLASPLPFTANSASTITVTATVDPNSVGLAKYTNNATVTTSSLPAGGNDPTIESVQTASAAAAVTVQGATTVKSVTPINPTVGDTVNYQITVTVPPNENFYSASVIDTLPVGISLNSGSDVVTCAPAAQCPSASRLTDGAVTASGQKVGWFLGDLTPISVARTVTVTFTGTVTVTTVSNTAGTVRNNQAYLAWNTTAFAPPPTNADDAFQQTGTPGAAAVTITEPLLTIAKSVSTASPAPGSSFTYTVTVTNSNAANRSTAFNTVVTDVVPVGVIVNPASLSTNAGLTGNSANGGGTITWTSIAPILPGAANAVIFTYSASLAPSSTLGTAGLANTATIPSYDSRATGGRNYNNVAPATQTVTPVFPKLTLSKPQPNPSTAYRGQSFNWTIGATNSGAADAKTVVLTDALPPSWTYDPNSAIATIGGVSAGQINPVVTGGGATLTWSFGPLGVGKSILITYSATPGPTAITGSVNLHTNTVTAQATDATNASGNSASSYSTETKSATAHIDQADVTVVKSAGAPLVAGTTVASAWTITVTNTGPDQAVGSSGTPFTVTDSPASLPTGVTVTAASGVGWACITPAPSGSFSCTRTGTLNSGASFPTISVAVAVAGDVPNGTSVTNSAAVSALTFDPTVSTSTKTINVVTNADLAISKVINGTPLAGRSVSWTIGVSNLGPSVSAGPITVTDTLPSTGLTNVSAFGTGWTCPQATPLVCTRTGALSVGPANSITVTGTLASSFTGTIDNTATVAGPNNSNPANDTASTSTTVDTTTALTIGKGLVSPITPPATTPAIVPGQNAVFQFVVTNTGQADARTVAIADPLPGGLSYVAGSANSTDGWTCSGTTTVSCVLAGTLPATTSNTTTLQITATTPPTLTGGVTNTATVTSANAPSNSGSAVDPANPHANFSITKTHPAGPVIAGNTLIYTLTAKNLGPSDSPGSIVVTDTLPTGMSATAASISGTGWSCTVASQVITCSRATSLASGVTAPVILVTATISSDAGPSTLVNAARVTGPLPSTDSSLAATTDSTVITDSSVVTITKTVASGATVRAGENAAYSLAVHNAGPSTADSLSVSDALPAGMTAVSIAGPGWTCTLASLTCSRPSLAPGDSIITVVATVAPSVPNSTVLQNIATVDWLQNGAPQTASGTANVTVVANADLALTKVAATPTVNAGDTALFTLTVKNMGPSDARGAVTIVDTLPTGLSYLSSAPEWTCTPVGQNVSCVLGGSVGLAAGATASILTLTTQVDAALGAGTVTNSAVASSGTADGVPANNTATATVTIGQSADLSIVKSHTGRGIIGNVTVFTLAVSNAGPSTAAGVSVLDTLPMGLSYVDFAGSDPAWNCSPGATDATTGKSPVTCTLTGTIAPQTAAPALRVRATVGVAAYPSVDNVVVLSSTTTDPNIRDNTSTDTLAVDALVDLSVKKTHLGQLTVGKNAYYLIAVTNSGPTEDPGGFFIVDTLPSALSYVASSGSGVSCVAVGQKVTCTFAGALAVGATRSVTLTVTVLASAYPQISNTANVSSLQTDLATLPLQESTDIAQVAPPALPFTGGTLNDALIALALLLLLLGVALVIIGYRRRRADHRAI